MPERAELHAFVRRLGQLGAAIAALLVFGTVGLALTEDRSLWDAFVWALDTIATVGSVPAPVTTGGQIVKVTLVVTGVGTLFYALVTVTEFFVAGHMGELLTESRQQRVIDSLTDHTIICGFGRVGRQVARDLQTSGHRYVIVDSNPRTMERAQGVGVRAIIGSPSEDEVLIRAGIERARAIVACVDSDAENIFVTLTARELRGDDILVVARASEEDSEKKLRRAGADRVISPYKSSGAEMARLALHPQISGVVDVSAEFRLEEIDVVDGCDGAGLRIEDLPPESIVVGLRRDTQFVPRPPGATTLRAGDVVVALGPSPAMDQLEVLFDPVRAASRG
jgi:voltage-gated potassium channel